MLKREGKGGSKPTYKGIPSPSAAKKMGSQKAITKATVKTSAPSPAPKPDVTLGGDETPRRSGYKKPPKVSKSSRPVGDLPYRREDRKRVEEIKEARKKSALKYYLFQDIGEHPNWIKHARKNFFSHPTNLARSNYKSVSKELFDKLDLKGKSPKLVFNEVPKVKGSEAYAYSGKNAIYVEPGTAEEAQRDRRRYVTLAHETAHTRQQPGQKGSEGLAEAFAETKGMEALRKLGIDGRFPKASKGYERARKRVKRRRSHRYITKGQFEYYPRKRSGKI